MRFAFRLASALALACQPLLAQQSTPPAPAATSVAANQVPAPSDLTINGSGSSFVYPILSQWIYTWDQDTASDINYNPVGSVLGEQALAQGTVTFAASEIPLPKESLQKREQAQFPIVLGGVVICVNLPNMKASDFVIDGKTLVAIYEGKITRWDDPAIKALNPDLDLPGRKITPVFRTDGSGTTWAFAQYLTKNDPEWGKKFPTSAIIDWPVGIGARGNVELAAYISTIPYSLGYVEYAYAIENRLKISSMRNADGKIVQPDLETFTSTLDSIDWDNVTNFDIDLVDRPGANAWPITAMSFIIMSQAPKDEDAAKEILRFFDWCYNNGSSIAKDLYFVPLPDEAVNRIHAYWSINIQANGKPVYR